MTETPASLLIVDADREFARMLAMEAEARAFRARVVGSVGDARSLLESETFDALVVGLVPGAESALQPLSQLKRLSADAEVIVLSDSTSMAGAIQEFDPDAFASVRKSDIVQVFAAIDRALERRRITRQNRRLVWELQTINEIASGIARSLELDDVLMGALQGLVRTMDAAGGAIRLRDEVTGVFETSAVVGPAALQRLWSRPETRLMRPSDHVIATRAAVVVEDFAQGAEELDAPLPLQSAISVPLLAGEELLGTLSLGSMQVRRFGPAEERLLATIGRQIVVAIQNARLHQSIRQAKREWEKTFDAISDPIAVFNSRGQLLRGNRALAGHLSRPVTGMPELTCGQVGFCGTRDCLDAMGSCVFGQQPSRREVTLPDGRIFSVTTFPIGAAHGRASVVQVAKNVTEEIHSARRLQQMSDELAGTNGRLIAAMDQLRAAQTQLLQAEKLSAIGHLVAGVAHELNNPLTTVIGYAQLVEEELQDEPGTRPPEEIARDVRRIAEEAERAARIVWNLLAFARRQSTARAPQDVAEVWGRVLALREYELGVNGIAVLAGFPERLPQVFADGGQLQQVLLNLVLNAERAMRGAAVRRLSVTARHDEGSGAIELTVADTGHGIDAASLPRVFDPFFTTRDVGEGTGLGLSICYGVVRDHGGTIRAESRPGAGTTIRIALPARLADPAVADTEVLVAHKEQSEREFFAAAFRGWGYRTTSAATIQEALESYRRPGVQIAVVDRSILEADLNAWTAVHAAGARRVAMILTSVTMEDREIERFSREAGLAVVGAPVALGALLAAVRARVRECK